MLLSHMSTCLELAHVCVVFLGILCTVCSYSTCNTVQSRTILSSQSCMCLCVQSDQYIQHTHVLCVHVYVQTSPFIKYMYLQTSRFMICCLSENTISQFKYSYTYCLHCLIVHCSVVQLHSIIPPLPHTGVADRL